MSFRITIDVLRKGRVFGFLNDEELRALGRLMAPQRLLRGQTLFAEGERSDAMALVAEGMLGVGTESSGSFVVADKVYPGEVIGVLDCLVPGRRSTAVVAEETSTVFLLSRRALERVIERRPSVDAGLRQGAHRELVARLRDTHARIDEVLAGRGARPPAPRASRGAKKGTSVRGRIDLRRVECFRDYRAAELRTLLSVAPPLAYEQGHELCSEGARAASCYFVASGQLAIERTLGGRRWTLGTISEGCLAGATALLDPVGARSARYVVTDPAVVLELQRKDYERLLGDRNPVAVRLQAQLTPMGIARFRDSTRQLAALLAGSADWQTELRSHGASWQGSAVERAHRAISEVDLEGTTSKQKNTLLLSHLQAATNEWGLDLEGFRG